MLRQLYCRPNIEVLGYEKELYICPLVDLCEMLSASQLLGLSVLPVDDNGAYQEDALAPLRPEFL
ncbi:MAG: hypothetical protein IJS00_02615 [Paludibacteraceae bacterium]|nr:hypothetical protein [Paludibacteraceae bacterium]